MYKSSSKFRTIIALIIASIFLCVEPAISFIFASTTDGTIDSTYRYAWSENAGWIDFGSTAGTVHVTDTVLTGSAYGENIGWITLNPSTYGGVSNTTGGSLSGYAWSENTGWIDFSGVTIGSDGVFEGNAYGENIGWITFGTGNNKVLTDWRPSTARSSPAYPLQGTITVIKTVINNNGGSKTVADFPLFVNDVPVVSGVTRTFLAPTTAYTVTETADANYVQTFSGGCDSEGKLNLVPGDNKVCTITNDDIGNGGASVTASSGGSVASAGPTLSTAPTASASPTVSTASTTPPSPSIPTSPPPSSHFSSEQITSILEVLASFGVDTATIAHVQAILAGSVRAIPTITHFVFTRDLAIGMFGEDVKLLQQFLNMRGFVVARAGNGSLGSETSYFGRLTQSALAKFQEAYGIMPSLGYFGSKTRDFINNLTP